MCTIKELRELLTIDPGTSVETIEKVFRNLAELLLNGFAIKKGKHIYRFVEIEFYHNYTDNGENITYPRKAKAGEWFFHDSGVDLTFNSDDLSYRGILIRSIKKDNDFICGPHNVEFELFDQFSALETPDDFPCIIQIDNSEVISPVDTTRWNIKNDKRYRYCLPNSIWQNSKKYTAYPWYCNGKLKK